MKRFPFKRQVIILVSIIAALCVAIPVATFAKGTPPGEQKRSERPKVTHNAQSTTVTITTDCSSVPLQLVTTLQISDTLNASATLISSDPDEESEGETLVIQEQNSSFTRTLLTLDVATGSATITPLTATVANDNINACINGIDSDETGTVTFSVTSATRTKLFIFVQGIDTQLTQDDINKNRFPTFNQQATSSHPEGIYPYLKSNITNASFMMYSYTGQDSSGNLLPYGCSDTFVNPIINDAVTLDSEITSYAQKHSNTDIYLIGHSLGGVVIFGELALRDTLGWPALPNGNKLAGVTTLDSPLGGIPDRDYLAIAVLHYENALVCAEPSNEALQDLVSIKKTDTTFDPRGGMASIDKVLAGGNLTNQQLAEHAASNGVHVLTVGNKIDFTFDPHDCLGSVNNEFTNTQYTRDEGSNSSVYGREIDAGNPACNLTFFEVLNHGQVLVNSTVEQGLVDFINNNDPAPLLKPGQLIA